MFVSKYVSPAPIAYLSQIDVDGVLQELRGLPRSLLDGEHPDRLHARLQLDHTGVLILRER